MTIPEMQKVLQDLQIEIDSCLEIRQSPYSIHSKTEITKDTVLAKIPQDSILSIKNTAISEILATEQIVGLLGLALTILYETSSKSSPWYDYLSLINSSEYLPIVWSDADKSLLVNTDVGKALETDISSLKDDYETIIIPLISKHSLLPKITLDEYISASTLVTSRGFYVDEERGECLIPFGDLLNHSLNEHVHFTNDDDDCESDWESEEGSVPEAEVIDKQAMVVCDPCMEMVAIRDIQRGQEVFNTYGKHGNTDLLRLYGFTIPDNCNDYVQVDRQAVLDRVGVVGDRVDFWNQIGCEIVEQILEMEEENENDDGDGDCKPCDDLSCSDQNCNNNEDEEMMGSEKESEDGGDYEDEEGSDGMISINDDFSFESNSRPTLALYAFIHLLLQPENEFVEMSMALESTADFLFLVNKALKEGDKSLYPRVDEILVDIAQKRLVGYPEWKGGKGKLVEYVKILRDGELKILKGVVENYQK